MMAVKRILGRQDGVDITPDLETTQQDITDGTVIYSRWTGGTDVETIMKKALVGTIWTTYRGRGLWANRASLSYTEIELGA